MKYLRWALATFLAGWCGDVDPLESADEASWLYVVISVFEPTRIGIKIRIRILCSLSAATHGGLL